MGGGTLYDIASLLHQRRRNLFRSEPTEVMAISVNSGSKKVKEIDESTGALLRFDGGRVAASSPASTPPPSRVPHRRNEGTDIGRSGVRIRRGTRVPIDDWRKTTRKRIGKRDSRAELLYFSDCLRTIVSRSPPAKKAPAGRPHRESAVQVPEDGKAVRIPRTDRRNNRRDGSGFDVLHPQAEAVKVKSSSED